MAQPYDDNAYEDELRRQQEQQQMIDEQNRLDEMNQQRQRELDDFYRQQQDMRDEEDMDDDNDLQSEYYERRLNQERADRDNQVNAASDDAFYNREEQLANDDIQAQQQDLAQDNYAQMIADAKASNNGVLDPADQQAIENMRNQDMAELGIAQQRKADIAHDRRAQRPGQRRVQRAGAPLPRHTGMGGPSDADLESLIGSEPTFEEPDEVDNGMPGPDGFDSTLEKKHHPMEDAAIAGAGLYGLEEELNHYAHRPAPETKEGKQFEKQNPQGQDDPDGPNPGTDGHNEGPKGPGNNNQYMMVIDPALLLKDDEMDEMVDQKLKTTGEQQDFIQDKLEQRYPFVHVAQSTEDIHEVKIADNLLDENARTGKQGLQTVGHLSTPSDLIGYAVVDGDWIKEHPDKAKQAAFVKLDPNIDPKKFKATEGLTKNNTAAGFITYGNNKMPSMVMLPKRKEDYKNQTMEEMEQHAKDMNPQMRSRASKIGAVWQTFANNRHRGFANSFMAGWQLVNKFSEMKEQDRQNEIARQDRLKDYYESPDFEAFGKGDISKEQDKEINDWLENNGHEVPKHLDIVPESSRTMKPEDEDLYKFATRHNNYRLVDGEWKLDAHKAIKAAKANTGLLDTRYVYMDGHVQFADDVRKEMKRWNSQHDVKEHVMDAEFKLEHGIGRTTDERIKDEDKHRNEAETIEDTKKDDEKHVRLPRQDDDEKQSIVQKLNPFSSTLEANERRGVQDMPEKEDDNTLEFDLTGGVKDLSEKQKIEDANKVDPNMTLTRHKK